MYLHGAHLAIYEVVTELPIEFTMVGASVLVLELIGTSDSPRERDRSSRALVRALKFTAILFIVRTSRAVSIGV